MKLKVLVFVLFASACSRSASVGSKVAMHDNTSTTETAVHETMPSIKVENVDPFIEGLIQKMTLDEKLGQMTLFTTDWGSTGPTIRDGYENDIRSGRCGALFNSHTVEFTKKLQKIAVEESRLKIPLLFGYDVIHGYKTIFPIPLGEAASWDLEAMERSAYIMSKEAAAAGLHWTYAPMVDISRDPRWGRVMEGAGEDTYLGSQIAAARVKGIQGKDFTKGDRMVACVKHFAAYGAPVAGRDYNSVEISERSFRETYLPPYKAAVDAGALTVMSSFNDYNGVPATGNKYLLTDILRNEWGFEGFVVTDYTSINEMVNHGVGADETEVGILAANAGVDMDMQGGIFQDKIKVGINDGRISMASIDQKVRNILKIKKMLGLFEDPYRYCNEQREKTSIFTPEHLAAARDGARKSVILLKNENVLPLQASAKNILVVGPLADDKVNQIGAWSGSGDGENCISLFTGLNANAKAKNHRFTYLKGCEIEGNDMKDFSKVVEQAKQADLVIFAVGENKDMAGEAAARAMIRIPGVQEKLIEAVSKTGKPIVTIVMNGRPLVLSEVANNSNALVQAYWLGTQSGHALADVLYGDYNPSAKLTLSFPRHEGQIPVYYNHKNTGRPFDPNSKWTSKYLDMPNTPLYEFGYGLSYTTFSYSAPSAKMNTFTRAQKPLISVTVTNTGTRDGEEVVQLYIRDKVASVTRPLKELKRFQKIHLKAGESATLTFELQLDDLSFFDPQMKWVAEPGEFDVFVGGSSSTQNKITLKLVD